MIIMSFLVNGTVKDELFQLTPDENSELGSVFGDTTTGENDYGIEVFIPDDNVTE